MARTWFPECMSLGSTEQREAKPKFARHQPESVERRREECDVRGANFNPRAANVAAPQHDFRGGSSARPASPELRDEHERASLLAFSFALQRHRKRKMNRGRRRQHRQRRGRRCACSETVEDAPFSTTGCFLISPCVFGVTGAKTFHT